MIFTIKKSIKIFALLLISGTIIAGFALSTFLIFYEDIEEIKGSFEIFRRDHEVSKIELYNNVKIGSIDFKLLPESSTKIIEAFWEIKYETVLFESGLISFDISNRTNGDILEIYFEIEGLEYAITREFTLWNITVGISSNYDLYNFTSDSEAGSVNFDAYGIDFGKFEVKTTTGNVDIDLNRSIIFNDFKIDTMSGEQFLTLDFISIDGDIVCSSTSGFMFLNFWNVQFLSEGNLKVSSTTGKINARWATHFKKSHKVDVTLETNFNIEFRYWYPIDNTRFDVHLSETTGSSHFGGTAALFNEINPYHYQSTNIGDLSIDYLRINVSTNEGDIFLKLVDCFKPRRFCGRYDNTPHNENATGSYAIPKADYDVSTIKIYNRAENVVINFNSLPDNSANIIKANWLLTYWHGANYGYGTIEVKFTTEIEENTLIIYIDLVYELDRLRPVFIKCDFNVQVSPNYNFYYY